MIERDTKKCKYAMSSLTNVYLNKYVDCQYYPGDNVRYKLGTILGRRKTLKCSINAKNKPKNLNTKKAVKTVRNKEKGYKKAVELSNVLRAVLKDCVTNTKKSVNNEVFF